MLKRFLVACLAACAMAAQAGPVTFLSTSTDVTAIAISDAAPDFQSAASPPDAISASAASIGINVATAGSLAAPGLLSTSADVSGVNGDVVSAVSTSHFLGSFISDAQLLLGIDFMASDFMSGSGNGGTSLFVTLMAGTTTLFNDYLTQSELFSFAVAPGTLGTLELTLTSEANAGLLTSDEGAYSSNGLVSITTPVPEPATYLLVMVGLTMIGFVRRKS
jgi:PEP-CTERM motif